MANPVYLKPGQDFSAGDFSKAFGFSGSSQGNVNPHDETVDSTYVAKLARGGQAKPPLRGKTRNNFSTEEAANTPVGDPVVRESMSDAASAPPAQGHRSGGPIKKAFGGGMPGRPVNAPPPQNPGGALSNATLTMPVGEAANAVKNTFGAGRAVGARQAAIKLSEAARGRAMPPAGMPGAATALGAAAPPAPSPMGVPAMRKGGRAKFDDGGAVDSDGIGTAQVPMPSAGQVPMMAKGGNFIQKAINPAHKGALHRDLGVPQGQKIPAAKMERAAHSDNPTLRRRAQFAETLKGFHNKG